MRYIACRYLSTLPLMLIIFLDNYYILVGMMLKDKAYASVMDPMIYAIHVKHQFPEHVDYYPVNDLIYQIIQF